MSAILVVDDERGIRALCSECSARAGQTFETVDCAAGAVAGDSRAAASTCVLCDINLPDQDGASLLPRLLAGDPPPGCC